MDYGPHDSTPPQPPPPPSGGTPAGATPGPRSISYGPPPPQVVQIVAKPGGLARAVGFVLGLFLFMGVFAIGLLLGIGIMLASPSMEQVVLTQRYRPGSSSSTIAVLPVRGTINSGQAQFVRGAVDKILSMSSVKAVVLRVDSPGGGVSPSDRIWYEVKRLKQAGLPVVASYGGLAASGGYYVSCHADHIIAERTCVTGSIGVIAQVFTMAQLMDKVGVEPVTLVATGSPRKDIANDMFRTWSDDDRQAIRTLLDSAYTAFLERVRDGRATVIDDVERIADGSVFAAPEALAAGLIDGIGYLDDAIREAERRAGLPAERAAVLVMRQPPSLFGSPASLMPLKGPSLDGSVAEQLRASVNELAAPRAMYLMY